MEPWSQLTIRGCGRTYSEKAPGLNRMIFALRICVLSAIGYLMTTLFRTVRTGINAGLITLNSFSIASLRHLYGELARVYWRYDSRNDEIRERCQAYHNKYPEVWDKFVEFTFDRISKGYKHYSSNAIFERIRWEMDGVGADGKTTFKINDHNTPFYARRFHKMYKDHDGFFITR